MYRYLTLLMFLASSTCFAQSFGDQIASHREKYKADFISNEHSPLKETDLKHLQFYDADSVYKLNAKVTLLDGEKAFKMPTYAGTTADYIRYAKLTFELNGKPVQLTLYRNIALAANATYRDYLFLPFTDQTNIKETYGGGRYIDLRTTAITDGKIELDFNKPTIHIVLIVMATAALFRQKKTICNWKLKPVKKTIQAKKRNGTKQNLKIKGYTRQEIT